MISFIAHVNLLELDQISFFLYCLRTYADIPVVIAVDNLPHEFMQEKFVFINKADVYKMRDAFIMTFPNSCDDTFRSYMSSNKAIYINTIPSQYSAYSNKRYEFDAMIEANGFNYIIKPTNNGIYGDIEATDIIDEFDHDRWKEFVIKVDKENTKWQNKR